VNVGRAFLGDLPLGAASLGSLRASISSITFPGAILLLVAAATFLFTRERYALGQFTNFLANLLEGRGERNAWSPVTHKPSATMFLCILSNLTMISEEVVISESPGKWSSSK
jgi:hypothetical protein